MRDNTLTCICHRVTSHSRLSQQGWHASWIYKAVSQAWWYLISHRTIQPTDKNFTHWSRTLQKDIGLYSSVNIVVSLSGEYWNIQVERRRRLIISYSGILCVSGYNLQMLYWQLSVAFWRFLPNNTLVLISDEQIETLFIRKKNLIFRRL